MLRFSFLEKLNHLSEHVALQATLVLEVTNEKRKKVLPKKCTWH